MNKKPHLLITDVRRPGKPLYQFRIYGYPENQFPPIDMESTLGSLRRWILQGDAAHDELTLRRAGATVLPVTG